MTSSSSSNHHSFILASGSPRRQQLLHYIGIPFTIQPSEVHEDFEPARPPGAIATTLALRKTRAVAQNNPSSLLVGADTIVVHDDQILGKPADKQHARSMLHQLSGSIHRVLTGLALVKTDAEAKIIDECTLTESTDVLFGSPEPREIEAYVKTGKPMDKAGAYGIQDPWGAIFVKRIEGDYYNIVGLPVHALYHQLKIFAPSLLNG